MNRMVLLRDCSCPGHRMSREATHIPGFGLWALGSGLWALGSGLWALGSGLWALGSGLWALALAHYCLFYFFISHFSYLN
jgi:hypothetical protein